MHRIAREGVDEALRWELRERRPWGRVRFEPAADPGDGGVARLDRPETGTGRGVSSAGQAVGHWLAEVG